MPESQIRPAAAVLQELNRGRSHRELSDELARLTQAVRDTGRPGSVTLTITVKPSKADGAFEIADKISSKIPAFDRPASLFFADESGNLTREDPRQIAIEFDNDFAAKRDRDAREAAAGE